MMPDPKALLSKTGFSHPLIAVYDAPDPAPFAPLVSPAPGKWACVFMFYKAWLAGRTLHLTRDNFGCGGAGYWMFGVETRSRADFVKFLADEEGLKCSGQLMNRWLDHSTPYAPAHPNLLIGPLRPELYDYAKSIVFFVAPDHLSLLMTGASYDNAPGDPPAVIAPFGSGCSQLLGLFPDTTIPQAMLGATDIAMRQYLPPDMLALAVTKPLFEKLCALDDRSFLYKPFWQNLRKARGMAPT